MSASLLQIQERRRALAAECAAERAVLAEAWRGLERPVSVGERALQTLRSPVVWAGLGLLAFKLPKRKLLRIPVLLWKGWRLARRVRSIIQ